MYCPKCKNEYRKGIEICPECNETLVEELQEEIDFIELFRAEDENLAGEVARYFEHIGLKYDIALDPETGESIFSIDKKELKKAKQEAATVIKVYQEKKLEEAVLNPSDEQEEADDEEEVEEAVNNGKKYVSAKDRTNDYRSSGILFIIMGIVLVIIAIVNLMGIVDFVPAKMSQILMLILGFVCVIGGIASLIRSKAILLEVSGEEELIDKIKAALSEKFPPLTFAEMMEDSDTTPELRYLQVQAEIKKAMSEVFPEAAPEMLDEYIEEYCESMFD